MSAKTCRWNRWNSQENLPATYYSHVAAMQFVELCIPAFSFEALASCLAPWDESHQASYTKSRQCSQDTLRYCRSTCTSAHTDLSRPNWRIVFYLRSHTVWTQVIGTTCNDLGQLPCMSQTKALFLGDALGSADLGRKSATLIS